MAMASRDRKTKADATPTVIPIIRPFSNPVLLCVTAGIVWEIVVVGGEEVDIDVGNGEFILLAVDEDGVVRGAKGYPLTCTAQTLLCVVTAMFVVVKLGPALPFYRLNICNRLFRKGRRGLEARGASTHETN